MILMIIVMIVRVVRLVIIVTLNMMKFLADKAPESARLRLSSSFCIFLSGVVFIVSFRILLSYGCVYL